MGKVLGGCKPMWLGKESAALNKEGEELQISKFRSLSARPGCAATCSWSRLGGLRSRGSKEATEPPERVNDFQIVKWGGLLATWARCAWRPFHVAGLCPDVSNVEGKSSLGSQRTCARASIFDKCSVNCFLLFFSWDTNMEPRTTSSHHPRPQRKLQSYTYFGQASTLQEVEDQPLGTRGRCRAWESRGSSHVEKKTNSHK